MAKREVPAGVTSIPITMPMMMSTPSCQVLMGKATAKQTTMMRRALRPGKRLCWGIPPARLGHMKARAALDSMDMALATGVGRATSA